MRRSSLLVAAVAALFASPAPAQDAQTVLYDAQGRVIAVTTARTSGNATFSTYAYDDADNRTAHVATVVAPPPTVSVLEWPHTLVPTQKLTSANGQYTLTLEQSGDLVIRNTGGTLIWNSCTGQGRSLYAQVDSGGQLRIYDTAQTAIWTAGTSGNAGAKLTMENSGIAVLRTSGGTTLWSSTTPCA